jgi:hypothetical protein
VTSTLPQGIVKALDGPKTVRQLSIELGVTDARALWYLERLRALGAVTAQEDGWVRTPASVNLVASVEPAPEDCTVIPGRTVYDFRQAFVDAAAGMFGPTFVQTAGEHGTRLSTERAGEFVERLKGLIEEYFGPGRADREATKYGLHWVITPTDLHPLDDD